MFENPTSGDLFSEELGNPTLEETRFAIVDVETTGLDSHDRVLEVACLITKGPLEREEFCRLVNPQTPIPQEVVTIHGIKEEAVREAPFFSSIAPELTTLLKGAVLVAHNAPFDISFLTREWKLLGGRMPTMKVVDTLTLARNLIDLDRYSLDYLADALSLPNRPAHRALADVKTTHNLLWYLIERAPERPKRLNDLLRLLDPPDISWERAEEEGAIRPALEPLKEALSAGRPIRIAYLARNGETIVIVTPLKLERTGRRIFLRVRLSGDRAVRSFRLDRITSIFPSGHNDASDS
ncbi:MAG: WYL domain-containing protein [Candidatus Eisenbacteria bacterium]|uniref:WYL domain-containing protein n=1 Tax=Eiseniibacteriota bacterium TaxID=2212470 RepID=A0A948RU12_UNCEI|nr:WYL domain-containing protein [Candidatus Eisenbacteria bacterium]MBU1949019.1 WYL domain-containing protein [Candidatus Eisenbacteria bacterium]MBU2689447.1 WYL domain-containing protein [Candidatus Eisenbacteria bacterium]